MNKLTTAVRRARGPILAIFKAAKCHRLTIEEQHVLKWFIGPYKLDDWPCLLYRQSKYESVIVLYHPGPQVADLEGSCILPDGMDGSPGVSPEVVCMVVEEPVSDEVVSLAICSRLCSLYKSLRESKAMSQRM